MLVRVHQNDGVLVEHAFVALNHNFQITLVLEINPRTTVGQHIAAAGTRHMERGLHAPLNRSIPRAIFLLDIDAEVLVPEREFSWVPELSPREMNVVC